MVALLTEAVLMEAVHMEVVLMVASEVVVIDRLTHVTGIGKEEAQAVVAVMVVVAMVVTEEEVRNLVATVDQVVEAAMHLVAEDGAKGMVAKEVVTMAVTPDRIVITEGMVIKKQSVISTELNM